MWQRQYKNIEEPNKMNDRKSEKSNEDQNKLKKSYSQKKELVREIYEVQQ